VAGKDFILVDYPSDVYRIPDTHECIDGSLPLRLILDIDVRLDYEKFKIIDDVVSAIKLMHLLEKDGYIIFQIYQMKKTLLIQDYLHYL